MSFSFSKLADKGYFQENRLEAHSDHVAFANRTEMDAGSSSLRMSLNGYWRFFCAQNEGQVIPGFEKADFDCHDWDLIPVPAHIQMEGYGVPQYCNTQYPWDGHENLNIGEVPTCFNPVACYVRYFYIPDAMKGKEIRISFQGAESCIALWLNGSYVGFSADSFTPEEFDLTPYIQEGENKLACRVYRWCAGSWLEDQDFFRFSGIFRDVYLYAVPSVHMEDIRIKTLLDDDYRNAVLEAQLKIKTSTAYHFSLELMDGKERISMSEFTETDDAKIVTVRVPVVEPRKWSSEDPYLYDLFIRIFNADNELLEIIRQRIGFRRFEIKDGLLKLNGVRIVFKGTDRHDFCAESGRAIPREKIDRDLLTMKRANINAVRTSHYPNSSALYELCDELGIYLIAENNMETHGIWDMLSMGKISPKEMVPGNLEEWQPLLLDRVNSGYQLDKNHPSVLIWSCGNESLCGSVICEMSNLFRRLDDTRPVHYESVPVDDPYAGATDIESSMYTPVTKLREFLSVHRKKPFILCEYVHAMGNSNGAMHKYTEYAYEEPLYQGGFIWDFIDESIRVRDRFGKTAYNYGGDFDDRPNDGNFCGNGIVYGNGEESPKIQEIKYNYQNIIARIEKNTAHIINRNMFTRTGAYDCLATLARYGKVIAMSRLNIDIAPLSEGDITLPFDDPVIPGEYTTTLSFRLKEDTSWAPIGYEIAFSQGVFTISGSVTETPCGPLRIAFGVCNLGVKGDCFEALFSYREGLTSYRYGGRELLKTRPMPNFWRAPTDNDRGNNMAGRYAQWKLASLYARPSSKHQKENPFFTNTDGSITFRMVYELQTTPAADCELLYTVHPSGRIDVHMAYEPVNGLTTMPEFGVMLKMDADYSHIRWYGLGPKENYSDRHTGAKLGIWNMEVTENISHYLIPQECGNRTGVRWAEVTDARGRGLRFSGNGIEFSALPYTPHELENAAHENELPPVQYTVIRCAKMQMGIAGDDSWGARTHEEYLIDVSRKVEFDFSMEGI